MATKSKTDRRHQDVPTWEWIIAALGALLLLAVIAFTSYRIANDGGDPAGFSFEVDSVTEVNGTFVANISVINTGDQTAAALAIEGSIKQGEQDIETSTATLTYAPANSKRQAALIFTKDPRKYTFEIRPVGFEKP